MPTVDDLLRHRDDLVRRLRRIDTEYTGRELPADVLRKWQVWEGELDELEPQIAAARVEEAARVSQRR